MPLPSLLQWVRGPKTAVSIVDQTNKLLDEKLQWVRGPKTAVSQAGRSQPHQRGDFNGSAVRRPRLASFSSPGACHCWRLQWVRGPKTAVSLLPKPVSGWRGRLQWVRGPKTAVSRRRLRSGCSCRDFNGSAVRRPRLAEPWPTCSPPMADFNGSAVRRPRLAAAALSIVNGLEALQWVRGPKTAVSASGGRCNTASCGTSMGPRSEDRG